MKHLLVIVSVFFAVQLAAQSRYESGMQKGLEQLKEAKTADDMIAASGFFERIADAEKDKWLPYYYAAYANHISGWMNAKADKDKVSEKTKDLLGKAEAIERNSDTYCLRQMVAVMQMTVDPMARYQSYGAEAANALASAKKADPANPRVYLIEGQYMKNVPEAFGGGKAVAKKLAEKSLELFATAKPASPFHPSWGKDQAEQLLAACQ
ncbi:hypothetical protein [Sediminibacterium ginsengisoli]|uniref:Uncharacterized protein n=1 Tax=Sediminibacterium ginsengisoli TaxID=413434 RepID=A0A1T4JXJ7_9BACT|nr:hypothetical protein [Sediminibacterium ginsengisoli]SJZ34829.1 hypothetical protein SAMN04488132_101281 [Sediminibacterium ginsengisoli]